MKKLSKTTPKNNYATKKDISKLEKAIKDSENNLEKKLDTKFTKRLQESLQAFRNENNHNFLVMREDFQAQISKFTNMILTAIDPLIKDMETRQQEREVSAAQYYRTTKKLENHEKRIEKLEQS